MTEGAEPFTDNKSEIFLTTNYQTRKKLLKHIAEIGRIKWNLFSLFVIICFFLEHFLILFVFLFQMKFVRNVTEWIEKKPVIYHGHTAFLDFSRYIKLQSKYTKNLG